MVVDNDPRARTPLGVVGVGVERGWEGFWEQGLSVLLLFYYEGQQRLQGQFLGRSQ